MQVLQDPPVGGCNDNGKDVADGRENEQAGVALGQLVVAGNRETDEETQVHARVVPQESRFAAVVLRFETLGQHHVQAGDVQAAAGQKQRQSPIEQSGRAAGGQRGAKYLQHHAADEQVAIAQETAAEVTAEQMQTVVERTEHAHQDGGVSCRKIQVSRRI